ncbi:hypothetical protein SLEP1_g46859 [Rubroshorea leprosula]|uniref:Uncharacterized protein n=1 Tax=Rubroshorea leprosula TaxID=152421 RepID=A0AAV5LNL2_9ROSI|nr:hypothetical protein SLEP1_g46859 [Rubroshorea leprosula]
MGTLSSVTATSPCFCSHYGVQFSNFAKNSIFSVPRFKNRNPIYNVKLSSSIATRLQVSASSTIGARNEGGEATPSFGVVGKNDLLIVGPGVLGRLVAEKWREEHPGCQVYGQTMTTDHHDELIKMGINPLLKGTKTQQFPYVIFCAPPSQTSDYPGDVRMAALSWSGEGSFLFTSSSAPFDCSDNGPCDEDTPVMPIGRSPKTDVLLKAEQVVLEFGGCVVRLAGLYISFLRQ